MGVRETQLRAGLSHFLAAKWLPGAQLSDLARIPGGASRETWRLKARAGKRAAATVEEAESFNAEWARALNGEIWRFLEAHAAL